MAYIGNVSWIYTCLHLIKNCRKWSDRSSFDQSMNMAPTDSKQKKKIRKKEYLWNFILCTKTICLLTSIHGGSSKGNKLLWCVYGFNYTPRFNLKSVSVHKQIHSAFPGKIGNCIHIKCHSLNVFILKQVPK